MGRDGLAGAGAGAQLGGADPAPPVDERRTPRGRWAAPPAPPPGPGYASGSAPEKRQRLLGSRPWPRPAAGRGGGGGGPAIKQVLSPLLQPLRRPARRRREPEPEPEPWPRLPPGRSGEAARPEQPSNRPAAAPAPSLRLPGRVRGAAGLGGPAPCGAAGSSLSSGTAAACAATKPPPQIRRASQISRFLNHVNANAMIPLHDDLQNLPKTRLKSHNPLWNRIKTLTPNFSA
ncbi:translation initiation factor IF-2-like [Dermochelys coriacea]|uniref:translation initiation factor IF-2-like n=1 Tax=Dermochelys coriacea TaxID=27794 RepID=UPI001CA9FF91|nr:translation initiation factor IF-2-like [Dermochelys coriacea]